MDVRNVRDQHTGLYTWTNTRFDYICLTVMLAL
jgi:hypothetical protein